VRLELEVVVVLLLLLRRKRVRASPRARHLRLKGARESAATAAMPTPKGGDADSASMLARAAANAGWRIGETAEANMVGGTAGGWAERGSPKETCFDASCCSTSDCWRRFHTELLAGDARIPSTLSGDCSAVL
jgi:hypothetical protein